MEKTTIIIIFDEESPNWWNDMEKNFAFLEHMKGYINEKLDALPSGMFLREICDELGIQRPKNYIEYGIRKGSKFEPRFQQFWLGDYPNIYEGIEIKFDVEPLIERFEELF